MSHDEDDLNRAAGFARAARPARAFCKSGMTVTSQGGSKKELPVVMLYPGSILGPGISKPAVNRAKT